MRVYRDGKWVSLNPEGNVEHFTAGDSADSGDSKSNTWLWVGLGVIAAVLVLIAVWYMMKKKKSGSSASTESYGFGGGDAVGNLNDLESIMDGL